MGIAIQRSAVMGLALWSAALPVRAEPAAYSAREIRAQVVDDITGVPLEGVVVVAQWQTVREIVPGFAKPSSEMVKAVETRTDAAGRFLLPAWGPIARPLFHSFENNDPRILLFRAGYYPRQIANEVRSRRDESAVRVSQWDGTTIRLRPYTAQPQEFEQQDGRFKSRVLVDGSSADYAIKLQLLQRRVGWGDPGDGWKQYPQMIRALSRERERLGLAGLLPLDSLWGGEANARSYLEGNAK
jgi:hypothetical protein